MPPNTLVQLVPVLLAVVLAPEVIAQRDPAHIAGRSTDWQGCPLAGARVTIIGAPGGAPLHAVTDENGNYELRGVPRGQVTISAELVGFLPAKAEAVLVRGVNHWDAGLELGILASTKPLHVAGLITGNDGAPVANASVTLWNVFSPARLAQVRSDEKGRFVLETFSSGQFIVSAVAQDHVAATQVVTFGANDGSSVSVQLKLERRRFCSKE